MDGNIDDLLNEVDMVLGNPKTERRSSRPSKVASYKPLSTSTGDKTIDSYYDSFGKKYDIDPNLLYAQGHQESGFRNNALSNKGARGIAQFMPGTAAEFGVNPNDPQSSIRGQAELMRRLLDRTGDIELALAGYNSGHNLSIDALRRNRRRITETRDYVDRITKNYRVIGNNAKPATTDYSKLLSEVDSVLASSGTNNHQDLLKEVDSVLGTTASAAISNPAPDPVSNLQTTRAQLSKDLAQARLNRDGAKTAEILKSINLLDKSLQQTKREITPVSPTVPATQTVKPPVDTPPVDTQAEIADFEAARSGQAQIGQTDFAASLPPKPHPAFNINPVDPLTIVPIRQNPLPDWVTGKTPPVSELPSDKFLRRAYNERLRSTGLKDSEELRRKFIEGYAAIKAGTQNGIFTPEEENLLARAETERSNRNAARRGAAPNSKTAPAAAVAAASPLEQPQYKQVFTPPKEINYPMSQNGLGGRLFYDAENTSDLKEGEYRYRDESGKSYLLNPTTGKLQDEAAVKIVKEITVPLADKGANGEAARNTLTAIVADEVSKDERFKDIPREDVEDYYRAFGFTDFNTGKELPTERLFKTTLVNPVTGITDEIASDTVRLTERDLNNIREFSAKRKKDKEKYDAVFREYLDLGFLEEHAEIAALQEAGAITKEEANQALEELNNNPELQKWREIGLSDKDINDLRRAGKNLQGMGFVTDLAGGYFGGGVKNFADRIAGAARALPFETPYETLRQISSAAGVVGSKALEGRDKWHQRYFGQALGGAYLDVPQLMALSSTPLGAIGGFGVSGGLESAGRGESASEIGKHTVKGGLMGALFGAGNKLEKMVGAATGSRILATGTRIGTVGLGTGAIELNYGATPEQAIDAAVQNIIFDVAMHYAATGKVKIQDAVKGLKGKALDVYTSFGKKRVVIDEENNILEIDAPDDAVAGTLVGKDAMPAAAAEQNAPAIKPEILRDLSENKKRVLETVARHEKLTPDEVARQAGLGMADRVEATQNLTEKGLLKNAGDPEAGTFRYSLPNEVLAGKSAENETKISEPPSSITKEEVLPSAKASTPGTIRNQTFYHGSPEKFDTFQVGEEGGIFFSDKPDIAERYGEATPVKLDFKNPKIVEGDASRYTHNYADEISKAKSEGYDSLVVRNTRDLLGDIQDQYIAFSPEQIIKQTESQMLDTDTTPKSALPETDGSAVEIQETAARVQEGSQAVQANTANSINTTKSDVQDIHLARESLPLLEQSDEYGFTARVPQALRNKVREYEFFNKELERTGVPYKLEKDRDGTTISLKTGIAEDGTIETKKIRAFAEVATVNEATRWLKENYRFADESVSGNKSESDNKPKLPPHLQKIADKYKSGFTITEISSDEIFAEKPKPVAKVTDSPLPDTAPRQTIYTERGTKAEIAPKVVDSSDLLTSLDKGYPQEFQPRDRSRQASKAQISEIAGKLNPEFLGDSLKASDGRPLVVPVEIDGKTKYAVISGNGRTEGIREAYRARNEGSQKYAEFARAKDADNKSGEPVYVGVLDPKQIDLAEFAREANESATAKMSATEQAKADAERMSGELMQKFVAAEDGSIHGAANRDFIRGFMETVPASERGALQLPDGSLSQEGVLRVRNAIFAKAFGDSPEGLLAIQRMAESTDNNVKNITSALLQKAGELTELKEAAKTGTRSAGYDITNDLSAAMEKYSALRDSGASVDEYLAQQNLFGAETTPFQNRILQTFDFHKRSSKAVRSIIDNFLSAVEAIGDPNQNNLFGAGEKPNVESVFEGAVKSYEKNVVAAREKGKEVGLFDQSTGRAEQPAPRPESDATSPRPEPEAERSGAQAVKDAPKEPGGKYEEEITEMHAGFPFLNSLFGEGTARADSLGNAEKLKLDNPEVERRMGEAEGIKPESFFSRAKTAILDVGRSFRRTFPDLDPKKDAAHTIANDLFRQLLAAPSYAKAVAADKIAEITRNLGKDRVTAFSRFLIFNDIMKDVEAGLYDGKDLPYGITDKTELQKFIDQYQEIADTTPAVKDAIEKRQNFVRGLTQRMVDLGLLNEEVLKDSRYYHRQVMSYVDNPTFTGTGGRDARVHQKGFQKGRTGGGDFNTRYQEAEFEWVAQALSLISRKEILGRMKQIADIKPDLLRQAEVEGKDWQKIIPEGYEIWQPQKGNYFYPATSIAERMLDDLVSGRTPFLDSDVKNILAMGGAREQWVVPSGIARTLENFQPAEQFNPIESLWSSAQATWKQWVLLNPARVLKYNLNNTSGDLDIALAYDPKILKSYKSSAGDLWRYQIHGTGNDAVKAEIQEAIRLGVVDSGLSVAEIPDINKVGAFRVLMTEEPNLIQKGVERYWTGTKAFTNWRENILRLAAYRYFKQQIADGKTIYGASSRKQIDAITEPNEKAAKLARELVGDYGAVSTSGRWIRRHLIPFYSWIEINAPRYARLLRNVPYEQKGSGTVENTVRAGAVLTGRTAIGTAKLAVKANLLFLLGTGWNHLMYPEEEKKLKKEGRTGHLIIGVREDGTPRAIRVAGALSDALSWFGLEDYPSDIKDLMEGKATWQDKAAEAVKAPANKIINSWEPVSKTTFELVLGKTAYPSIFEEKSSFKLRGRSIRDRAEYALKSFSLDGLYRRITGRPKPPSEGGLGGFLDMTVSYRIDPAEANYFEARGKVSDWAKKQGKETAAAEPTEKGNALYYYKQAIKWGDKEAAKTWLKEYQRLGGTPRGMRQSIERAHPLAGIARKDWGRFLNSLSKEEKSEIEEAIKFYRETFLECRKLKAK